MTTAQSSICNPNDSPNVVPFARTRVNTPSSTPNSDCTQQSEYNNYYYTHAREDITMDVQEISEMYLDTLGRPMPRFVLNQVQQLITAGIQPDMICAVLAYTAGAPRPSWSYAYTVIQRQAAMGAKTAADFHGNVNQWRQDRAAPKQYSQPKRVIEQRYEQRTYDSSYNDIPADQLEEMNKL